LCAGVRLQLVRGAAGSRGLKKGARSLPAFILPLMQCGPIVLVGGATSWPRGYRRFAELLEEVSGSPVRIARITPLDWARGYLAGFGQLVFEVATAVDRALLESPSDKVVLIGHSAGGLACRVYLGGDKPYGGRRWSGHRRVSRLITLGTPHVVKESKRLEPISRINGLFPGALHTPSGLRYVSVASQAVDGTDSSGARRRYERFAENGSVMGDGVVPVESALLPGSEHTVLDGLLHNRRMGRWYGSDRETVEDWWPEELRAEAANVETSVDAG
jgi:pimeloyl-ACP methyl ester carboxylesterase